MTEKEETHIEKKRTTALKIIIDEDTKSNEQTKRDFLAKLFDFPEYATAESLSEIHVTRSIRGAEEDYIIYSEMLPILKENNIDVTTFKGYKEVLIVSYTKKVWDLDTKVKEITGITSNTYLHYRYTANQTHNSITTSYLLFQLTTTGKTKTEIKGIHKENVCKFLNYLRMRKVAYMYDCEWEFTGSRACQI